MRDRKRGRGTVKITEVDSGVMVMVRPCGAVDNDLVTVAISCWRAGIYRGRAQMQEVMERTS